MTDTIVTSVISLLGIIITALITRSNFQNELDKKIAVLEVKLDEQGKDLKSHNDYAKHIPQIEGDIKLILEKQSFDNQRMDELARRIEALEHRND